jgi:hypothetical protein
LMLGKPPKHLVLLLRNPNVPRLLASALHHPRWMYNIWQYSQFARKIARGEPRVPHASEYATSAKLDGRAGLNATDHLPGDVSGWRRRRKRLCQPLRHCPEALPSTRPRRDRWAAVLAPAPCRATCGPVSYNAQRVGLVRSGTLVRPCAPG